MVCLPLEELCIKEGDGGGNQRPRLLFAAGYSEEVTVADIAIFL